MTPINFGAIETAVRSNQKVEKALAATTALTLKGVTREDIKSLTPAQATVFLEALDTAKPAMESREQKDTWYAQYNIAAWVKTQDN